MQLVAPLEYFIEIRIGKMRSCSDFLPSGESQIMQRIILGVSGMSTQMACIRLHRPNVSHVFPSHRLTASSHMSVKIVAGGKEIQVWLLKIWPA